MKALLTYIVIISVFAYIIGTLGYENISAAQHRQAEVIDNILKH